MKFPHAMELIGALRDLIEVLEDETATPEELSAAHDRTYPLFPEAYREVQRRAPPYLGPLEFCPARENHGKRVTSLGILPPLLLPDGETCRAPSMTCAFCKRAPGATPSDPEGLRALEGYIQHVMERKKRSANGRKGARVRWARRSQPA